MKLFQDLTGSERRFLAFLLSLFILALSGPLQLQEAAVAAVVALSVGYLGQGAVKEAVVSRRKGGVQ